MVLMRHIDKRLILVSIKSAFYFERHVAMPLHTLHSMTYMQYPRCSNEHQFWFLLIEHGKIAVLSIAIASHALYSLKIGVRIRHAYYIIKRDFASQPEQLLTSVSESDKSCFYSFHRLPLILLSITQFNPHTGTYINI